jgi:hypothetical protein
MRNLSRTQRRIGSMAVILLAITVAGQAVHAKASHYSKKSPESVYFSASVKIANLVHDVSGAPDAPMIVPGNLVRPEPHLTSAEVCLESRPAELSRPISSRLLRSPPAAL